MRVFLLIIVFLCCFNPCVYSVSVSDKLSQAKEYIVSEELSRAIHTYEMVALDRRNDGKIRARAWYEAAVLYEERLREYSKAYKIYERLVIDYPEFDRLDKVVMRLGHISQALELYAEPMGVLKDIRYTEGLSREVIIRDVKILGTMIKKYPEFYNIAKLHALAGNRYIMLSRWLRAYLHCKKVMGLNPDLYSSTPLNRDYELSKDEFFRSFLTRTAWVFIVLYIVMLVILKPWKHIRLLHIKYLFILVVVWVVVAGIVYSVPLLNTVEDGFPLIEGIETPESLSPTVYVALWYRPFVSARFWLFILYSVIAIVLTWMGLIGIKAKDIKGTGPVVIGSMVVTVSLLILFFYYHSSGGFRYKNFLFWQEDSDAAIKNYPDIFRKIENLEEDEKQK